MIAEHESKKIEIFNGLFDRGEDDAVPPDHSLSILNCIFDTKEVKTRPGSTLLQTITGNILRVHTYEKSGEATRYLILKDDFSIYDSTSPASPILTVTNMTDFSCTIMFDRAYISPHNGDRGLPGQSVYIYEGAGNARLAAGAPPATAPVLANSATAGSVEIGLHLFAIAFETTSGFITKYGTAAQITASGGKKVDISSIPVGPSGTIARWIVATKVITNYNGNPDQYEFFFVPGGRIGDNATTTASVSFFDASLVSSAAYLLDNITTIPAGVKVTQYKGSLVVTGEDANPARVRFSAVNQPEAFSGVTGFLDCYPKDNGGTVRTGVEFRGMFIMFKSYRCYVTQTNNDVPSTWQVTSLDVGVGTECFGVQEVLDIEGQTTDRFVVAARRGLILYDGTFNDELSGKIYDTWSRINKNAFNKVLVSIDPLNSKIYVAVPLDAATVVSHILYADYVEGMNSADIKWSVWQFPVNLAASFVDIVFSTKSAVYKFVGTTGNIYYLDPTVQDDFGNAKTAYWETSLISFDKSGGMCFFSGIRARITGVGNLQITAYSLDKTLTVTAPSITLSASPGQLVTREFFARNESISVRFLVSNAGEKFSIRGAWIYGTPEWAERPNF